MRFFHRVSNILNNTVLLDHYLIKFIENPQDVLFDKSVVEINEFFSKVNHFEKITTMGLKDIWKISGPSFQHIKVNLDM